MHALRGVGVEPLVEPGSRPEQIARQVKLEQDLAAALDTMTICALSSYAYALEDYARALSLVTETAWTRRSCSTGARIFALERQYNSANGAGA